MSDRSGIQKLDSLRQRLLILRRDNQHKSAAVRLRKLHEKYVYYASGDAERHANVIITAVAGVVGVRSGVRIHGGRRGTGNGASTGGSRDRGKGGLIGRMRRWWRNRKAKQTKMPDSGSGKAKGHLSPKAKIHGEPDATNPIARAREQHSADRYANRPDVVEEVYMGEAAKSKFNSPDGEKFPDVVAVKKDGTYGLGEGKGTDMEKAFQQFEAAGNRIRAKGGHISEQEVVVEKLKVIDGDKLAGHGWRVDKMGYLEHFDVVTERWGPSKPNGIPIKVIVYP